MCRAPCINAIGSAKGIRFSMTAMSFPAAYLACLITWLFLFPLSLNLIFTSEGRPGRLKYPWTIYPQRQFAMLGDIGKAIIMAYFRLHFEVVLMDFLNMGIICFVSWYQGWTEFAESPQHTFSASAGSMASRAILTIFMSPLNEWSCLNIKHSFWHLHFSCWNDHDSPKCKFPFDPRALFLVRLSEALHA